MSALEDNWQTPEVEEARALRECFTACLRAMAENGDGADAIAAAIVAHLATITAARLPLAAQLIWREKVARPLKADAAKPLPQRSVAAIRSWPSARIRDLRAALGDIESLLVDAENDALHEAIYADISRHYS